MHAFLESSDFTTNSAGSTEVLQSPISIAPHIRTHFPANPEHRLKSLLNPLLNAAFPLLNHAAHVQLFNQDFDAAALQAQLCQHIQAFEQNCERSTLRPEQVLLGRYFLCALLDDVLEHTQLEISWLPYSLLDLYYQENVVDYRLFNLIDRLKEQPAINLFLLEMAYMILVYGYQGIYRREAQGSAILLEKMNDLYRLIRWQQGDFRKNLFMALSST
jgi:type VI secretion system protein ImpK